MRVILDTNVFVSGVYFSGPPYEILSAWRHGHLQLVISPEILDEYRRVGNRLAASHPGVDLTPFISLVTVHGEIFSAPPLVDSVCDDPTDDMFFACAVAAGCHLIISGDKHLHRAHGYKEIEVYSPRQFMDKFLSS